MTTDQMLKTLIDCCEKVDAAKKNYDKHPGGGASQKIKNKLYKAYSNRMREMNNAVYNIKQFLK